MVYILTPAFEAPDMVHLDPSAETRCDLMAGQEGEILHVEISHQKAWSLLRAGSAIACRRCLAKRKDVESLTSLPAPSSSEAVG